MSHQALAQLRKEVGLGNVKETSINNLSIFKYTPQCVFSGNWNSINRRARGIVFDTIAGRIVARPFNKFFNLGERPETEYKIVSKLIEKYPCRITEKLDGTMISLFYYNGEWLVATPGSLKSDQANYVKNNIIPNLNLSRIPTNLTLVCEFISPNDREVKVIDYKDREDLTVLSAFENKWDLIEVPTPRLNSLLQGSGLNLVQEYHLNDGLNTRIPPGEEGYVIHVNDLRIKVKGRWYLRWHRVADKMSMKGVIDILENNDDIAGAPNHLQVAFDDFKGKVLETRQRIEVVVDNYWSRAPDHSNFKECAKIFKESGSYQHILFARMRGKNEDSFFWKAIRNELLENSVNKN